MRILMMVLLLLTYVQVACAGLKLEAEYPYHLEKKGVHTVYEASTVPLYVNIVNHGNKELQEADIKLTLPQGFMPLSSDKWQVQEAGDKVIATAKWSLPEDYGQTFDLLYIEAPEGVAFGEKKVLVEASSGAWQERTELVFTYEAGQAAASSIVKGKPKLDKRKFNWYIQSVTFPVDS